MLCPIWEFNRRQQKHSTKSVLQLKFSSHNILCVHKPQYHELYVQLALFYLAPEDEKIILWTKKIILKLSFVLYWKLYYCSKNSWGLLKIILCWPYLGQKVEPNQKKEALEPIGSSGGASGEWCAATTAAAAPPWPAVLASRCSSSARAALTWPSFNSELTLYYCLCLQYHKRDCSHPYISLCANEYKASYLTPYFSNSKWSIFSSKVLKNF